MDREQMRVAILKQEQIFRQQVKSSNSDCDTAVSSTSTESERAELKEFDVAAAARFQSNSKKRLVVADEMNLQPPWINQCLSLRLAWVMAQLAS
ncbi:hypothetical protein ABZP36_021215 [Zizania latifolia]